MVNLGSLRDAEIQLLQQLRGMTQPNEYTIQHELGVKAAALIKRLDPEVAEVYKVKREVSVELDDASQPRSCLDILISNGPLARIRQEIMVRSSQARLNEHVQTPV